MSCQSWEICFIRKDREWCRLREQIRAAAFFAFWAYKLLAMLMTCFSQALFLMTDFHTRLKVWILFNCVMRRAWLLVNLSDGLHWKTNLVLTHCSLWLLLDYVICFLYLLISCSTSTLVTSWATSRASLAWSGNGYLLFLPHTLCMSSRKGKITTTILKGKCQIWDKTARNTSYFDYALLPHMSAHIYHLNW